MPFYNQQPAQADWNMQTARGLVYQTAGLSFSGYSSAVDGTWIPIWDANTTYVYPSVASTMLLYSTSASDTNVSILINGLDANYAQISETLVLTNGTTGVSTVKSYFRIQSISVVTTTSVNPVGNIILGNSGKTEIYAQMNVGTGRSNMTLYTVPANYTFYLTRVNVFSDQKPNAISYYRSYNKTPTGIVYTVLQAPFTQNYTSVRVVPRPYPEKTDIQWQCTSTATSAIGLQVEGILIPNSAM